VRAKFEAANPTLRAAQIGIDESKAQEVTAYLRPNPDMTAGLDQLDPFTGNPYRPLGSAFPYFSANYLHERAHKRELRLESAQKGTTVAVSQLADQQRNLLFTLRGAFVQALLAKAVLTMARESLAYYDRLLAMSSNRFQAGDIARVDLDRLELQRVQFASDVQTAETNVRTAKIQLLMLLNDRTPVEQFDIAGPFDFSEPLTTLEELRQAAVAARPDLQAAVESVDKARTDYHLAVANAIHPYRFTSGSASTSRCASSIATRGRKRAPSSTSSATNGCGRLPRRRSTATWIRPGPRSTATWRCCGRTRPNTWRRRPACAKPFRSPTSAAELRCSTF
jgi:cobalt-zinc-cadmium efflux system outer membrane protein